MNRNGLYVVIALLAVAVIVLGFVLYQQQTRPGLEVRVDQNGVSIDGNG